MNLNRSRRFDQYRPEPGQETGRTIPWKFVAAGVVLIVGVVGVAKIFKPDADPRAIINVVKPPVRAAEEPAPKPVPKNAGRVTITTDPPGPAC